MKQFTLPMALADYVPVVLFGLAILTLYGYLKTRINKVSLAVFLCGSLMVFLAGLIKASYKLLYALDLGDHLWMSAQFFPNQALGFLLAGVGLLWGVLGMDRKNYAFLPTMALVGIMVVGLASMDASLCYLANKTHKRKALVLFIVSFFLSLMMGYLSSKDFDQAFMNWVAQGINTLGQLLLYLGARILAKD